MAASTSVIPGNSFSLTVGGTALGASTSCALSFDLDNPEVTNKDSANWAETIAGARSHAYTASGFYAVSSTEVGVTDANASITVGGTALKGWDNAALAFSCELHERRNVTTGLDVALSPKKRGLTLTVSGAYYDPAGTGAGAMDKLFDEATGATSAGLAVVVTFGTSQTVTFTARPSNLQVTGATGEDATFSVTLTSTGAVTVSDTAADAGLAALITAWEGAGASGSVTAKMTTGATDNTEITSTAYLESLSVTLPFANPVTIDLTLRGSGAPTVQATT